MGNRVRRAVLAGAATAAGAVGVGLAGETEPGVKSPAERFVVHEWGTFTSMQGEDGVALEGLTAEEEALPGFVYSRSKVRDCPLRDRGWKGLEVPAEHVTQKMETPVLYFHSATARRVRVRVDFMKGLISQWYPVSDLLGPPEGARDAGPLDLSKVERSFLQWDIDVLPRGAPAPAEVPAVEAADPWSFAREVDANWVRTLPRTAPERAGPVEAERYLFYRGLGAFGLPLSATVERGGKFTLRNSADVAVPFTATFEVKDGRARIAGGPAVPPRGEAAVTFVDPQDWMPAARFAEKLGSWMDDVLRKHGLAADEARAMVRTWSRSWFTSEGTRVVWIVPRPVTDALLPLSIDPQPDEVVRVLVGRLEIITPETRDEVEAAVRDRFSADSAAAARATARLERLGRFLEPHLRNVLASTKDETVRKHAQALLVRLRKG